MAEVFYTEVFETWDGSEGGKGAGDDNQWQFYDVFSNHNIPPSAVLEVSLANEAFSINYNIGLRNTASSGQNDDFRRIRLNEAEDGNNNVVMHIQLDSSGYLQYFLENFEQGHFNILGYWLGCDYTDRFDDITPVVPNGWGFRGLSSYGVGSGQPVEIMLTNSGANTDHILGAKNVYTDNDIVNRKFDIKEAEGGVSGLQCLSIIVPTSGGTGQGINAWTSDINEGKVYLLGYFSTPPGDYTESYVVFPTPSLQSVWTELDVGASGIPSDTVGQFCIGQEENDNIFVGVRQTDSIIDNRLLEIDRQDIDLVAPSWGGMHGNIDASGKLEYYCNDISDNPLYYAIGYWSNFAESSISFSYSGTSDLFITGRNPYVHYIEDFSSLFNSSPIDTWNEYNVNDVGVPPSTDGESVVAEILITNISIFITHSGGVRSIDSMSERRFSINDAEGGGRDLLSLLVPVSNDGKISVYAGNAAFINFQVIGYWKGAVYTDVHEGFQASANDAWVNYNLGSNYQNKVVEIVVTNNDSDAPGYGSGGIRAVGSSNHRVHKIAKGETGDNHITMHVNTSGANGTIQIYSSDNGQVVFTLVGCWDFPPGTYNETFTDIDTTDNGWQTIDAGISGGSVAEVVLEQQYNIAQRIMGVREVGSTRDRFWNIRETDLSSPGDAADMVRVFANISSGTHIDLYHEAWTQAHNFRLIGYWDNFNEIPFIIFASSDLYIHGYDNITTSGDLYVEGYELINASGDLFINGYISQSGQCDLFILGQDTTDDSADLYIYGYDIVSGNVDLFIHGKDTSSGNIDLFIFGNEVSQESGNLYVNGHDDIFASGDLYTCGHIYNSASYDLWMHGHQDASGQCNLFVVGHLLTSGSNDLYTEGCKCLAGSKSLFVEGSAELSGTQIPPLFIHGHTIAISSGDLFISGSGIIPYSGSFNLFVNGYEQKPVLACPILDPTASIQISNTLITIYQERIDALINQLGKNIYLEFDPISNPCPNCKFDVMRKRSTGIYISGGPRPFARGRRCPYCKGRGFTETAVNKCIKCLIKWNPEDAEDFGISIAKSNDIARLKTYLTEADDLVRANTAILNHDIVDQMKMRARMVQSPIPVGLREDRYCISFWELI